MFLVVVILLMCFRFCVVLISVMIGMLGSCFVVLVIWFIDLIIVSIILLMGLLVNIVRLFVY